MTHVERFWNVIRRKSFDRILISYWATRESTAELKAYMKTMYGTEDIIDAFDLDFANRRGGVNFIGSPEERESGIRRVSGPSSWSPPSPDIQRDEDGSWYTMWGVRCRQQSYGSGSTKGEYSEVIGSPLANAESIADVEKHTWPGPAKEYFDFDPLLQAMQSQPNYPFIVGYAAMTMWSWEIRGMQEFMQDLAWQTEIPEAIINHVAEWSIGYFRELLKACRSQIGKNFVGIHFADDLASQNGLFFSPDMFRRLLKRHYQTITDMAHKEGLVVEFHICGAARKLIPDLIDAGVDILNPIQTNATGMAPTELKKLYGKAISFSGGANVQTTLPFGSVQQVRDEAKFLLETLGGDGGYIFSPSHAVQVGTPPENIVAMMDTAYKHYGMELPLHLQQENRNAML